MARAYLNGIRIEMDQNATIADYEGLVGQAAAEMIQFRETWGDDDFIAISRTGDAYTLQRINGQDVIIMGPVPPPVPEEYRPRRRLQHVDGHYVPAFHTIDASGNFLGLTLCLSGKWGPPYKFVPCNRDDILNFDDGQWNIYGGHYPPDPEEYVFTLIEHSQTEDGEENLFDVPAAHQYVPLDANLFATGHYKTEWTGGPSPVSVMCTQTRAHMFLQRPGMVQDYWSDQSCLLLWTNWDGWEEDQTLLVNYGQMTGRYDQSFYKTGGAGDPPTTNGTISVWTEPGKDDACSIAAAGMAAMTAGSGSIPGGTEGLVITIARWPSWNINIALSHVGVSWSSVYNVIGPRVRTEQEWGTFDGLSIEEGSFFGALTQVQIEQNTSGARATNPDDFPNFYTVSSSSNESDGSTSYDFISVMGEEYVLREFNFQYGLNKPGTLRHLDSGVKPRIYKISDDEYITLASVTRIDEDTCEYFFFGGDVEQYNDPDATFDLVGLNRHRLDILVGDQEVFGNREFSLVFITSLSEEDLH